MKLDKKELAGFISKAGKTERIRDFRFPYMSESTFCVDLAFASRFALNQIRQFSSDDVGRRNRNQEERLNEDRLNQGYAERIIKGWKGLTVKGLDELVPGTYDNVAASIEEARKVDPKVKKMTSDEIDAIEVEYDVDTAISMLASSVDFMSWVTEKCGNAENYSRIALRKKEQYENLKP